MTMAKEDRLREVSDSPPTVELLRGIDPRPGEPSSESLRKTMEIEWNDHFQTRSQTWRTLHMLAALTAGFIGVDWHFNSRLATFFMAMPVVFAGVVGMLITKRNRNDTERRKFRHILACEEALGLHGDGLIWPVKVPCPIGWRDVIRLKKTNTSLFIMRIQMATIAFVIIYTIARLLGLGATH